MGKHCHETGQRRGILCRAHNTALGLFKDDPSDLRKAADYLEKYKTPSEEGACIDAD